MEMVFVTPAAGARVRQPERQSRIMPGGGDFVPRDAHYERLIATGDVIVGNPPAVHTDTPPAASVAPPPADHSSQQGSEAPAAPAAIETPAIHSNTSGRRHRASAASED